LAGGINVYAYAGGDPLGAVDPLGLDKHHIIPQAMPLRPEVRDLLRNETVDAGKHNNRDSHSEINPRAYDVYGPKLVATRVFFEDRALESRFLTEEMGR
jgi:hypothetical protein